MAAMKLTAIDDEAISLRLSADDDELDVTTGDPRAFVRELFHDDVVKYGVWEVTPGGFAWENAGYGELMRCCPGRQPSPARTAQRSSFDRGPRSSHPPAGEGRGMSGRRYARPT